MQSDTESMDFMDIVEANRLAEAMVHHPGVISVCVFPATELTYNADQFPSYAHLVRVSYTTQNGSEHNESVQNIDHWEEIKQFC